MLLKFGLKPRRAYRPHYGLILTRVHRAARVNWCRRHLQFTDVDKNNNLFTDESRVNRSHADGRVRVYRRRGEHCADACVLKRNRFGCGSAMIWCGISGGLTLSP